MSGTGEFRTLSSSRCSRPACRGVMHPLIDARHSARGSSRFPVAFPSRNRFAPAMNGTRHHEKKRPELTFRVWSGRVIHARFHRATFTSGSKAADILDLDSSAVIRCDPAQLKNATVRKTTLSRPSPPRPDALVNHLCLASLIMSGGPSFRSGSLSSSRVGGILGVMYSIPLRRALVTTPTCRIRKALPAPNAQSR